MTAGWLGRGHPIRRNGHLPVTEIVRILFTRLGRTSKADRGAGKKTACKGRKGSWSVRGVEARQQKRLYPES